MWWFLIVVAGFLWLLMVLCGVGCFLPVLDGSKRFSRDHWIDISSSAMI